jgi:hypothetical protein
MLIESAAAYSAILILFVVLEAIGSTWADVVGSVVRNSLIQSVNRINHFNLQIPSFVGIPFTAIVIRVSLGMDKYVQYITQDYEFQNSRIIANGDFHNISKHQLQAPSWECTTCA